jgi:hypothetical protein
MLESHLRVLHFPCLTPEVAKYPVSEQYKGPGVPNQIKYINRLFQRASQQHSEFFHDMWLWIKWRKAEKQHERDKKLVIEEILHD